MTYQTTDHLSATLFHFGTSPRDMGAELLRLTPGTHAWDLTCDDEPVAVGALSEGETLSFSLPPRQLCALTIGVAP